LTSIQRRLSLGLAGVLLAIGLVLAQSSLWLFDRSLRTYLQDGLQDETQTLLSALVRGPVGVQLDEQRLSAAFQRPYSGLYFRIDFAGQTWRSRSLWDPELTPKAEPGRPQAHGDRPPGPRWVIYPAG
jgi:hypothetical protein